MNKILIAGAGGAPTENVVKSWEKSIHDEEIIGMGSISTDLMISRTKRKYFVPYAYDKSYKESLLKILDLERPAFFHAQNDLEIIEVSKLREEIEAYGTKLYLPSKRTIDICVDKGKSAKIWNEAGIQIPQTRMIDNKQDLKKAFEDLGDQDGNIWIRATVGAAGKGALPTNDFDFACKWIDRFNGWGSFAAAELLTKNTVTWLSIWYEGELIVAQTRKRNSWNFGNRTLSGVTGVTGVGETCSDETVTRVALDSIKSIDERPNGIYGVDMTYDRRGIPNPTEINIARFFTTVYFFTAAGLNMPEIYKNIALYGEFPSFERKINPLQDGLIWIRGMDREPRLTTKAEIEKEIVNIPQML
jgi:carbamoyl-phosphate synthase large subunit